MENISKSNVEKKHYWNIQTGSNGIFLSPRYQHLVVNTGNLFKLVSKEARVSGVYNVQF